LLRSLPLAEEKDGAALRTFDEEEEDAVVVDAIVEDVTERLEGVGAVVTRVVVLW
jgi:hypothetical protein